MARWRGGAVAQHKIKNNSIIKPIHLIFLQVLVISPPRKMQLSLATLREELVNVNGIICSKSESQKEKQEICAFNSFTDNYGSW